jgi:aminoglycoside phosphotransferase (APT) family kinase protein
MEFSNKNDVANYLTHKLDQPCQVVEIEKFGRGSSRETWFITFKSGKKPAENLVFRRDPVAGATDFSPLSQEYFIYERLGRTSVPVAKALWWEDDPKWAIRPFYVRQHIDGSWNVAHYSDPSPDYDDLRIRISKEHMRKIALVHAVDWKTLELNKVLCTAPSVEESARHYIDSIAASFEALRIEPIPIFLEAVEWLKERAPVAPEICLCKGTNGLGEEIFRGEELVAMSDWEEAQIGDPAADFAFMQNFAGDVMHEGKKIWGLEQALEYYRSVGGTNITVASVQYYQLVRALRMMVFSHHAAAAVRSDANAPIRQAWTGTEVLHFGKHIIAAAMGLMPMPDASYMLELNTSVENAA